MKRAESIRISRGRVLAMVGLSAGATLLARRPLLADDEVRPLDAPTSEPGSGTSFGPLEQIEAGVLSVGYAEAGPIDGRAAILLHGWPYDIHTYVDVAPLLAAEGCRVIVPYLRGYGTTRFLSGETARNGRQSVIAV